MQTHRTALLFVTAALLVAAKPAPGASGQIAPDPILRLSVLVPPSVNRDWSEQLARTLADCIASAFAWEGFDGRIVMLDANRDLPPNLPRLEIKLREGRRNRTQSTEGLFSARLVTAAGYCDLGVFGAQAVYPGDPDDRLAWTRSFESAATDAAISLYRELLALSLDWLEEEGSSPRGG